MSLKQVCSHRHPQPCRYKLDEEWTRHYKPGTMKGKNLLKFKLNPQVTCLVTGLQTWLVTVEHCCSVTSLVSILGTTVQTRRLLGLQSWTGTSVHCCLLSIWQSTLGTWRHCSSGASLHSCLGKERHWREDDWEHWVVGTFWHSSFWTVSHCLSWENN